MAIKLTFAAPTVRKAPAERAETVEAICRIPLVVAAGEAAATTAAAVAAAGAICQVALVQAAAPPADHRTSSQAQAA
jgi:hypothetical protein